ncbi:NAD(P)-dependent oxidoreductase [Nocardioides renjunii]|uniref:NAD(P)-dependent oxidoreductase n=1 Tax=Nocardioides renjunii TaxID=3095075 RepID=UPI002AFE7FC6|nr:NAD(P)-binding oxidoreductase [Nocardioides sp. S-34]WQQ20614.1 NAD(P)-binding oxidoreductase [Nocardioides sp. S-34]
MKVLVVGASRGTGAELVAELAGRGHLVTAYARRPGEHGEEVRTVTGDVLDADSLAKAMIGQDAVAVTLGIPDNPFRVRLTRRASSRLDVRSAGTAAVVAAMREQGVRRLVVQSTYGIGDTYRHLPLALKAFFTLAIRPQVRDHEVQERLVRESGLAWTIVRPTVLHDDPAEEPAYVSTDDRAPSMRVSRRQVARVEADALEDDGRVSQVLSVTAPA